MGRYKEVPRQAYNVDPGLKSNIRFIKANHFEYGSDKQETGPQHFVTMKELCYRPADVVEQAALNVGRIAELRKSHFLMGNGNTSNQLKTLNQMNYSDKTRLMPRERHATKNLRESHFTLGNEAASFVSHNMVQYRDPSLG